MSGLSRSWGWSQQVWTHTAEGPPWSLHCPELPHMVAFLPWEGLDLLDWSLPSRYQKDIWSSFWRLLQEKSAAMMRKTWKSKSERGTWGERWGRRGPVSLSWPHSLVGASESPAETMGSASEGYHKRRDKRVVTLCADEWRMPWACLPRAQVPSTDAPEVAGLALLAALTFAGRLGGTMGPPCAGVQELLFQSSLFKDPPVGVSSSPSAGSSSALPTPLKAAGGIPSPSPAAERGWGGPALPSPGLWEQSEGDTGAQRSCRQGITWQLCIPVGAPWSWGSQPAWGCPSLGFLRIWNPGVLGHLRAASLNLNLEVQ